jgi:hypothetical protein
MVRAFDVLDVPDVFDIFESAKLASVERFLGRTILSNDHYFSCLVVDRTSARKETGQQSALLTQTLPY